MVIVTILPRKLFLLPVLRKVLPVSLATIPDTAFFRDMLAQNLRKHSVIHADLSPGNPALSFRIESHV
jgi:hypothetical protein